MTVLERGRNLRPGFGAGRAASSGRCTAATRSSRRAASASRTRCSSPTRPRTAEEAARASPARRRARSASSAPRSAARRCTTTPSSRASGSRTSPALASSARSRARRWPTGRSTTTISRRTTTRSRSASGSRATRCDAGADARAVAAQARLPDGARTRRPYVGGLLAEGARRVGYTAYPQPAAVNSQPYQGPPGVQLVRPVLRLRLPDQRPRRRARLLAQPRGADRARARDRACVRVQDRDRRERAPGARGPLRRPARREAAIARRHRHPRRQPDQHRAAAADVGQQRPPERARQPLRPGRPQHDVPQLHARRGDLHRGRPSAAPAEQPAPARRPDRAVQRPRGAGARTSRT